MQSSLINMPTIFYIDRMTSTKFEFSIFALLDEQGPGAPAMRAILARDKIVAR